MDDNQKALREWPIAPTFLSLRQGCKEDDVNYNDDGVYYSDYIRGFLADLSNEENIKNALSIFQFVPKDFFPYDQITQNQQITMSNPGKDVVVLNTPLHHKIGKILGESKKIIRIDSGTYVNNGRLCDVFRKCQRNNTHFCFKQDSIVGIYADEELNGLDPYTIEYKQKLDIVIKSFNKGRLKKHRVKREDVEGTNRSYIHYTCPYSLFEEHIFPIYAQNRIIACLMLGQMARDAFNGPNSFSKSEYWEKMKAIDPKILVYLKEIKRLDSVEWNKKVQVIVNRIEKFETRLEERIDHKNTIYIRNAFDAIEKTFREKVKSINIKKLDAVKKFTEALNQAFKSIREKFDNSEDGFIRIFALPIDIKHEELVPIGWSDATFNSQDEFKFGLTQLNDIENYTIDKQREMIYSAASPKIKEIFDKAKGDLFLPGWLAGNEVAYISWKRHDRNLKKQKAFDEYIQALRNFYSISLECYSYIRGAKMELLLETTIQESAHESAHFILPAIDIVEKELDVMPEEMMEKFRTQVYDGFKESYKEHKDEVLESLHQLREINNGSSLILSPNLQIDKKPVLVFDLLYKLKKTLNNRSLDSHKNIYYNQSEHSVTANIDAKYMNHALYNLLDNAIKYGYEGSKILINMDVDRKENMLIIEIVSYGIEIESGDWLYQLFTRSEKAEKVAGGTGLGLYTVKKICEAHGGTITQKSEKLSDYNVPVLFNYKYRNTLANKKSLGEIMSFEKELSRLSGALENEVVYDPRFVQYARVFSTRIHEPTYRNTFRIAIPLN